MRYRGTFVFRAADVGGAILIAEVIAAAGGLVSIVVIG